MRERTGADPHDVGCAPHSANPDEVGVAVIGTGVIARVIASALADMPGARLRLVVGRREEPARELATAHAARWSAEPGTWLARALAKEIGLVIVTTPSGTHADVVVPLLEAGKHVVIEKPLDVTLAAADRICAAEARTGRVVAVISQHRFDSSFESLLAAAEQGRLGRLTSVIASCAWWRPQEYYDSAVWRGSAALDGGVVMNQAIHLVDLMLAIMGPASAVHGLTATLAHDRIDVEDTAVAAIEFASGALGSLHATTAAYPGVETSLRVFGDRGSAVIVDDVLVRLVTADSDVEPSATSLEPGSALGPGHTKQIADVVDVIRRRESGDRTARPRVGTTEARHALEIVLAVYESARQGRPITLPLSSRFSE